MVSVLKVVAIQHGGYGGGDAVAQFLFIAQAQLHQVVDLGAYEGIFLQVVDHAQIDDHISALLFTLGSFAAAGSLGYLDTGIDLLARLVEQRGQPGVAVLPAN